MKEKLSIKFTDMPREFDCRNNYIVRALEREYVVCFSDLPDVVFYSNFGTDFISYDKSIRICISGEPVLPNFNDCDYAVDYHLLDYGARHFRAAALIGNVGRLLPESVQKRTVTPDMANRKFCDFVYSNDQNGAGARLRKEFFTVLSQYKQVDSPGRVLHNMDGDLGLRYAKTKDGVVVENEDWVTSKLNFLSQYKFTIAFENTALPGYTTEKMYHPIQAYSVPIYWGNPAVGREFNPKAFINANEYQGDWDALARRVEEVDRDDGLYLQMLREPPFSTDAVFTEEARLTDFLKNAVQAGAYEKNAVGMLNGATMSFEEHCRQGHVGMRTILKYIKYWLDYKAKRRG